MALTRAQIEGSPDVSTTPPVSRQQEIAWHRYYEYPIYWATPDLVGPGPVLADPVPATSARAAEDSAARASGEPNLHSAQVVRGFYIGATDGDIGHVEDFLVDESDWAVRYLLVDTRNWWPGEHVLVSPAWIRDVSWADSKVYVDLTQDAIRRSPRYDPSTPIQREYEQRLYGHYRRPRYWE